MHLDLVMGGNRFDFCWENLEIFFPSLPVSVTEETSLSSFTLFFYLFFFRYHLAVVNPAFQVERLMLS